jgi:choline kinase
VVVGGFGHDLLRAELARLQATAGPLADLTVTLVENPRFRDGNLLSLAAARPQLDGDTVLLNVDHIYRPAIAALVAAPVDEVTACVDTDRALGPDDMKVRRDDAGNVAAIAKTLTTYDAGYVGVTRVPAAALPRYLAELDAALADEGPALPVERLLGRLATGARPPRCRDISGHGWLEVDTPEDLAAAEQALLQPGWD